MCVCVCVCVCVFRVPTGLEDVSKMPVLVAELLARGWKDEEVKAALGENLLRVLKKTEEVRGNTHTFSHTQAPHHDIGYTT